MMTPQETEALGSFLAQLTQVQGITKDPQAASMIAAAFSQQPDAGYLLVQRAMLLDQALATSRAQINDLQNQLQAEREQTRAGSGGGFLDPASSWGRSAGDPQRASGLVGRRDMAPAAGAGMAPRMDQRFEPAQQYAQPMASAPRGGLFGGGGGGGGFLGTMAATAAGVAGGAFLFQGIENMMGHHGAGSGLLGDHAAGSGTTNNFYGADSASAATDNPARLESGVDNSGVDNSSVESDLDNGIDDLAGGDDFSSQDDTSSI